MNKTCCLTIKLSKNWKKKPLKKKPTSLALYSSVGQKMELQQTRLNSGIRRFMSFRRPQVKIWVLTFALRLPASLGRCFLPLPSKLTVQHIQINFPGFLQYSLLVTQIIQSHLYLKVPSSCLQHPLDFAAKHRHGFIIGGYYCTALRFPVTTCAGHCRRQNIPIIEGRSVRLCFSQGYKSDILFYLHLISSSMKCMK